MNVATWTIKRLALVAACIGLLALTPTQRVEAADSNPSSNGTAQVQWCKSMGGTPTVTTGQTVGGGLESVSVICTGGLGGSWNCHNFGNTVDCQAGRGSLPDWDDLAGAQPLASVAGSPTAPEASPSVAAPDDDREQDSIKAKSKKGKKGKKGGKGRK